MMLQKESTRGLDILCCSKMNNLRANQVNGDYYFFNYSKKLSIVEFFVFLTKTNMHHSDMILLSVTNSEVERCQNSISLGTGSA